MDYDDDGMLDLVVGDRNGYIHYYRRTSESPITLTKEPDLRCGGVTIDVGTNGAPAFADWNEDGEVDFLTGRENGQVRLYMNDTIDTDPVYNDYINLESSGVTISHARNCPQVVDMNQDGKKDLLCGANDYRIYYYENTGTNDAPVFSGSEVMINTGSSGARFSVNDWNEDGLLDVLASNYNGYIRVYIQLPEGVETQGPESERVLLASRNPFASSVVLTSTGFENGTITIFDLAGRTIVSQPFEGSFDWNCEGMSSGCYYAQVTDGNGSATLKLMKL